MLSNHVIDSDDEGDKIDDQLNGITIDEDGHQTKTKMGKSLPSRFHAPPENVENTRFRSLELLAMNIVEFCQRSWKNWNMSRFFVQFSTIFIILMPLNL